MLLRYFCFIQGHAGLPLALPNYFLMRNRQQPSLVASLIRLMFPHDATRTSPLSLCLRHQTCLAPFRQRLVLTGFTPDINSGRLGETHLCDTPLNPTRQVVFFAVQTSGPLIDVNNIERTSVSMQSTFAKQISCLLVTANTLDPIEFAIR